jgi:catechol 2,3-dioxygenase-like lactoylglutathione lyase family enzyme
VRCPPPAADERANAVGQADECARDRVAGERERDLEDESRQEGGLDHGRYRCRAGVKQGLEVLLDDEERRCEEGEGQPGGDRPVGRPRSGGPARETERNGDQRQAGEERDEARAGTAAEEELAGVSVGCAEDRVRHRVRRLGADHRNRQRHQPGEAFTTHPRSLERVNLVGNGVPRYDRFAMRALDHVQVMMPPGGEDDARRFYAGLLGLTEVEKPEPMRANGGVWFAEGLHVSAEEEFAPARRAHPALRVGDLDGLAATLSAAGHDVAWDDRWPGVRRFYTRDLFGNRVELLCST